MTARAPRRRRPSASRSTGRILAGWLVSDPLPVSLSFRTDDGLFRRLETLRGIVGVHPGNRLLVAVRKPYEETFRCFTLSADKRGRVRSTDGWRVRRTITLVATESPFGGRS